MTNTSNDGNPNFGKDGNPNLGNDGNPNLGKDGNPNLAKNRYIFTGAGAVLTRVAGAADAGGARALIGVLLGGLVGYNMLKRL